MTLGDRTSRGNRPGRDRTGRRCTDVPNCRDQRHGDDRDTRPAPSARSAPDANASVAPADASPITSSADAASVPPGVRTQTTSESWQRSETQVTTRPVFPGGRRDAAGASS
jgi:hypothetical protein